MIVGLLLIIILLLITLILVVLFKNKQENLPNINKEQIINEILSKYDFIIEKYIQIDKTTLIALNKNETKVAIIKNLNFKEPTGCNVIIFPNAYVTGIKENRSYLELDYISDGINQTLKINSTKKNVKEFVHNIYKKTCATIIKAKYPSIKFDKFSACNWQCDYVWAYAKNSDSFVYYDTSKKFVSYRMDLLSTNLTLDTKYSYLEMSIYNINQQLLVYDSEFYDYLFKNLLEKIKFKSAIIVEDFLYYDTNEKIAYLTNNQNSLQIIKIDDIEDVFYSENKLSFKLNSNEKTINYLTSKESVKDFEEFVIGLNVRKIAVNFNYSSDKLINTSDNTKLLIDFTRQRIVYCANLNSFARFGYYVFGFNSILNVEYKRNGANAFVRLYTDNGEKIDISCKKKEVAEYIMAQIKVILNER